MYRAPFPTRNLRHSVPKGHIIGNGEPFPSSERLEVVNAIYLASSLIHKSNGSDGRMTARHEAVGA